MALSGPEGLPDMSRIGVPRAVRRRDGSPRTRTPKSALDGARQGPLTAQPQPGPQLDSRRIDADLLLPDRANTAATPQSLAAQGALSVRTVAAGRLQGCGPFGERLKRLLRYCGVNDLAA
jgi:hypothetical protein